MTTRKRVDAGSYRGMAGVWWNVWRLVLGLVEFFFQIFEALHDILDGVSHWRVKEGGVWIGTGEFFKRDGAFSCARIFPLLFEHELHVGGGPNLVGFGDGCIVAGATSRDDCRGLDDGDGQTLEGVGAEIFRSDDGLGAIVLMDLGGSCFGGGFFRGNLNDRGYLVGLRASDPSGDGVSDRIGYEDKDGFGLHVACVGKAHLDAYPAGGVAGYEVMSAVGDVGAIGQPLVITGNLYGGVRLARDWRCQERVQEAAVGEDFLLFGCGLRGGN